ncbi:MAG: GFA family protein [Hyphomicrobiales bacterium]
MTEQTCKGGCHCGAVRYEAEADLCQAISCNCSYCEKMGFILSFTPRAKFRIVSGEDKLTEYRFNKRVIAHLFCSVCGAHPFGFGAMPDGTEMAAINLRCIDDIDLSAFSPQSFDGKSL